jgi:uncharacterized protein (DUF1697 family)
MKRQIVLLRGINVGGNRRVAMADLRSLLDSLGYSEARTHLQSGNVIVESGQKPERLKSVLERGLADELGLEIEVFVRTRDELAAVVARDPLGDVADNPSRYFVTFLSGKPDPAAIRAAAAEAGRNRFVAHGLELYSWHPDGMRDSALAKLLSEKRLGVSATARNWNTVTKLLELADEG